MVFQRFAFQNQNPLKEFHPILLVIFIVVALATGTLFWLKFGTKKYVPEIIFSLGISFAFGRAIAIIFQENMALSLSIVMPTLLLYSVSLTKLKQKKPHTIWYLFNNVIMIIVTTAAGGILGALFSFWVAIGLFALFAIYDAIAVWKTKHMVTLAENFIKKGLIPGISYPYKTKNGKQNIALLGGGDTMLIAFMATSFAQTDILLSYITIITMTIAVCLLFIFSKKHTYYPALPYIFVGMLIAFPIWWLI
jgi:presenilin-like A22 family membrane protease